MLLASLKCTGQLTRSLMVTCWMMPSGLMMNRPRSAMPAFSSSTPYRAAMACSRGTDLMLLSSVLLTVHGTASSTRQCAAFSSSKASVPCHRCCLFCVCADNAQLHNAQHDVWLVAATAAPWLCQPQWGSACTPAHHGCEVSCNAKQHHTYTHSDISFDLLPACMSAPLYSDI